MDGDRIGGLPDSMLLHILSFLSTKEVVATSVLSKRWRFLWHSVSTIDFYHNNCIAIDKGSFYNDETCLPFVKAVNTVLNSGDSDRQIQRFRVLFPCCCPYFHSDANFEANNDANDYFNTWFNVVAHRRVEHLEFSTSIFWKSAITIPTSFTTLRCLKLNRINLLFPSSVDFPSLKILHLYHVGFADRSRLEQLLSASPLIEDLDLTCFFEHNDNDYKPYDKSFTNLVKACVYNFDITLEAVKHVEFLKINWLGYDYMEDYLEPRDPYIKEPIPIFPNLTHLEFLDEDDRAGPVVQMLQHSPKLQFLFIDKSGDHDGEDITDWTYPDGRVPQWISSQLRTCYYNKYAGSRGEFQLASYILENATCLQSMTICFSPFVEELERLEMLVKLSMCTMRSSSCKLSFTDISYD